MDEQKQTGSVEVTTEGGSEQQSENGGGAPSTEEAGSQTGEEGGEGSGNAPETQADEEKLYDLPDGRKVDAATLAKEFTENFLPDYTRKSQRLADYEKSNKPDDGKQINSSSQDVPEWKKPEFTPNSYAEVIEIATKEAMSRIDERNKAEADRTKQIQDVVQKQLNEIKTSDKDLDEAALFAHANKYGFTDLKMAHENLKAMKTTAVDTEKKTIKNLQNRSADQVAGGNSAATNSGDEVDIDSLSGFNGAVDFLHRVQGQGKKQ